MHQLNVLRQRINHLWRLLATGISFSLFGIGGVLVPLVALPLLYCIPESRRQRAARNTVSSLFRFFIHTMRLLGVLRWQTEGLERLQREGLLILANHPTLIDVVFLIAFVPNADCIVKSRLLANPAMRGLIRGAGYITNDQGEQLMSQARESMEAGGNLLVFPEGTRTTPGSPLVFQRGAANIAVRCSRNITPVIITCRPQTLGKNTPWYDIPDEPVMIWFRVCEDVDISPCLAGPDTLSARRLNSMLQDFFTRQLDSNDNNKRSTQDSDHRNPRP